MMRSAIVLSFLMCIGLSIPRASFGQEGVSPSESIQMNAQGQTSEMQGEVPAEDESDQESGVLMGEPTKLQTQFKEKSFLGSRRWKGEGSIIGDRDRKMYVSAGDIVYTNLGSYDVREGSYCDIFRKITKVKDPKSGKSLGYEIRHVGTIEIIGNVGVDSSVARIIHSREPISIGDELKVLEK